MLNIKSKTIPKTAGVYFFRNKHDKILYIGKAINLQNRISSYFNKQPRDARILRMIELATSITYQETASEIEALILESQFIKKHKPQFNIMLRDDKQYFYVIFTSDDFPRIYLTHQPQQTRNSTDCIGPFTSGNAIKTTLRLLRGIFPYCTCKQKHNNYCLNYHIERCPGFCCLKNSPELVEQVAEKKSEYLKNIKAIKNILTGRRANLIEKLKKEMLALGKKHNFEKAIELRTKITRLEKVFQNAKIIGNWRLESGNSGEKIADPLALKELKKILKLPHLPHRIEGYDISNIQGRFATGAMVVFINSQSDNKQYRQFKINTTTGPNDTAMLSELLIRRFNHPEWPYPDLILVDGGKGQLSAAKTILSKIKNKKSKISIIALTKNEKHRGNHVFLDNKKAAIPLRSLPPAIKNLILQIDAEAHRFAIDYHRKIRDRSMMN